MWNIMHINNLKYYAKSIDMSVGICNMHVDFCMTGKEINRMEFLLINDWRSIDNK